MPPSKKKKVRHTKVATIEFDKSKWSKAQAVAWLRKNGYSHSKVDAGKGFYHFRQQDPTKLRKQHFSRFRTKKIATGLELVFAAKGAPVRSKTRGRAGPTAKKSSKRA